jgi:hypothetical protein
MMAGWLGSPWGSLLGLAGILIAGAAHQDGILGKRG